MDITRLSYWFPKLEAAGLPVPRTVLVEASKTEIADIWKMFDGERASAACAALAARVKAAADAIGYPCFLRTDHTSGKHEWERTCFLKDGDDMLWHIFALAEYSECASLSGLPYDVWAVREFLPTIPVGSCGDYGNMPICREFRFFVEDGNVKCWHPYWPMDALTQGGAVFYDPAKFDYETFSSIYATGEDLTLRQLASEAGAAVGGAWSVDILETRRGWFVTDMAEAHKSFHMEDCPHK